MTKYFNGTITDLEAKISEKLSDYRYQHVLRVRDYAVKLAKANDVDVDKAEVAALVHDYAKERSDNDFLKVIETQHMDPDLINWGNYVWHGIVGAEMIRNELGIVDEDILTAVRQHTTGAGASMNKLSQVIFMADYLELGRDFKGVEEARTITDQSLAQGIKYQIVHTLARLIHKKHQFILNHLKRIIIGLRKKNKI